MTVEYILKSSDLVPTLDATLSQAYPSDRDFTEATVSVLLQATFAGGGTFQDLAEIINPVTRQVRYTWEAPVPLAPGIWAGEWRVVWGDGLIATYPNHTFFYLKVLQALGGV